MVKIKPLMPSLRERKRYLVFEIISDSNFNSDEISEAFKLAIKEYMGLKGLNDSGYLFLSERYMPEKKKGIIKISNLSINDIKISLMKIKLINKKKAIIKINGLSGILKKAIEKFG